ncbi:MAG: AsmA family protein, partial [Gammaproteobacteria bacterium]|nr:AsmA family protein [Gammaproteobacteria bacterium]
ALSELGQLDAMLLPALAFELVADIDGAKTSIELKNLTARLGDSDLAATATLTVADVPDFKVRATSNLINLTNFERPGTAELESDLAPASSRVIPDTPLTFDDLGRFNADVDISVKRMVAWRTTSENLQIVAVLRDGALNIERFSYNDDDGHLELAARLTPNDSGADLSLDLKATGIELGIGVTEDQDPATIPVYNLDIGFTGHGATAAEVAATLNGHMLLTSDGGLVENADLDLFFGDFIGNVFDMLNPFSTSQTHTPIECSIVKFDVIDGIVDLRPGIIVRTDKVNMSVRGKADLSTEKLNVAFHTEARKGLGISAGSIINPYFKVGGTLASPKIELDAQNAAVAYGAAVATGGLSIVAVGLYERLRGERNPCLEFLEPAAE